MSSSEQALPVHATQAQQRVLERIAVQRERLRARRAARIQSQALAEVSAGDDADAPLLARAIAFTPTDPVGGGRATSRDAPAALTQKTEPVMASSIRMMLLVRLPVSPSP